MKDKTKTTDDGSTKQLDKLVEMVMRTTGEERKEVLAHFKEVYPEEAGKIPALRDEGQAAQITITVPRRRR